jgi:predicted Zn finger-like uncharacterized protein
MILTCPACTTKYAIADTALGPEGRKVKCVSCGHKWFQVSDIDVVEPVSFFAPPLEPESGLGDLDNALNSREIPLAATAYSDADDGFVRRSAAPTPKSTVSVEASHSKGVAWGIIALVAVVLLLALIVPRQAIMALWPNTTHLYRTLGLAPKEIGVDLEIRDARSIVKQMPDGKLLTIEGQIANTGHQIRQVPDIQAVETNNMATVGSWTFSSGVATLSGGKSEHFTASFPATGDTSGTIVLTFAAKQPTGEKNGNK